MIFFLCVRLFRWSEIDAASVQAFLFLAFFTFAFLQQAENDPAHAETKTCFLSTEHAAIGESKTETLQTTYSALLCSSDHFCKEGIAAQPSKPVHLPPSIKTRRLHEDESSSTSHHCRHRDPRNVYSIRSRRRPKTDWDTICEQDDDLQWNVRRMSMPSIRKQYQHQQRCAQLLPQ